MPRSWISPPPLFDAGCEFVLAPGLEKDSLGSVQEVIMTTFDQREARFVSVFSLLQRLESEIGSGAQVRFSLERIGVGGDDVAVCVRVDWWPVDFHAQHLLREHEIMHVDDKKIVEWLVRFFQHCFENRHSQL